MHSKQSFAMAISLVVPSLGCDEPIEDDKQMLIDEGADVALDEDLADAKDPSGRPSTNAPLNPLNIKNEQEEQFMCPPSPEPCPSKPEKENYIPWNPYPIPAGATCFRAYGPLCNGLCMDGGAWVEAFDCHIGADASKLQGWYQVDVAAKIWVFFDRTKCGAPLENYSQASIIKVRLRSPFKFVYHSPDQWQYSYPVEWLTEVNPKFVGLEKYVH